MGIGTGTGVGGSAVPPQITETVTTAYVELNKAALGILSHDTYEVIPFTQQDATTYKRYDTKASDPLIKDHLIQARMAKLGSEIDQKVWEPIYKNLINELPALIKELLITENNKPFLSRNLNLVILNNTLMATARLLDWMVSSSISPAPNSPTAIRNEINAQLSSIALKNTVLTYERVLSDLHTQLNEVGPNFAGHDQTAKTLNHLDTLLPAFGILSKQAAAGQDVKHEFIALSNATHQLAEQSKREGTTGILGSIISTLDLIAGSKALENGSGALLIGSHLANFGNSGALNSIVDHLVGGLQGSIGSSLKDQLVELAGLQSGLKALRDG
jgi:hypothetical protein